VATSKTPGFDPIEEARRQWIAHGWTDAADGMALVTSIIRAQQIYMARIDTVLRTYELTFARFELLNLLRFASKGLLPMSKIGVRLQVHPTSVTNTVDRLEGQGFVRRLAHATDRRTTLVAISPPGRRVVSRATTALNRTVFASPNLIAADVGQLVTILRRLRLAEGDFEDQG
jgi:DNA-binding MarR family transcriptional regulator